MIAQVVFTAQDDPATGNFAMRVTAVPKEGKSITKKLMIDKDVKDEIGQKELDETIIRFLESAVEELAVKVRGGKL